MKFNEKVEIRRKAEKSFFWFCRHLIGNSADTAFHRKMCDHVQGSFEDERRVTVVLAPRGHAKTTFLSAYLPLWLLARDNKKCILVTHGINSTAERIIAQMKNILIAKGKLLSKLWPEVFFREPHKQATDWRSDSFSVKRSVAAEEKASSVQVNGLTGTQAGLHFDLIIGDDLVNDQNYKTPGQLEATIECVKDQMNLLRGEHARYHFYGTIWNYNDASGWLLNTPEFKGRVRELVLSCFEENGEPVWPEVRSKKFLDEQRVLLGSTKFAQQYLNQRLPDGTAVFHEKDIKRYTQEWVDGRLVMPGQFDEDNPRAYNFYVSSDPNHSTNTAGDPAVVLVSAIDDQGDIWIVDVKRWWPSPAEFLDKIAEDYHRWHALYAMLEMVGAQAKDQFWLEQDSIRTGKPIRLFPIKRPPVRKFDRICPMLQPLVERGGLHVPTGGKFDQIIDEMRPYSSAATQDDIIDCLTDVAQHGQRPARPSKAPRAPVSQWLIDQMLGIQTQTAAPWGGIIDTYERIA